MMEKTCKNCVYRKDHCCTKLGEEILTPYTKMIDLLDEELNCSKLAKGIVEDVLCENDMINTEEWWRYEVEQAIENYLAKRFSKIPYPYDVDGSIELVDLDNDFYCKYWR